MRALEGGALDESDETVYEQSAFCLGCRACEPVCPAGVEYGSLLEALRDQLWRGKRRPWQARLLMAVVRQPWIVGLQGLFRRHARRRTGSAPVSLMLGCVERGLYPRVSRALAKLVPQAHVASGQGCCGALHAHNGDSRRGAELALRLGERLPGTILTSAGGCAAHLAAHLGRSRVREFSEYLDETPLQLGRLRVDGRPARVALQDSCHLRNGLGVVAAPRDLIRSFAEYVELPDAGGCCGAAGTYSLLRPEDSRRVVAPKLDAIEDAGVDFVAVLNPGCLRQLRNGLRRRGSTVTAVHLAELVLRAAAAHDEP